MRVKTFQGRTLEEVLPEIREELGPNAVVLGTRPLIAGGLGGFFGKRMVEVTAADRMPSDEELVELEDRFTAGESTAPDGGDDVGRDDAPAKQPATAGRSLDVVDDWDPLSDEEFTAGLGGGSRAEVATAGGNGYQPLELPQRTATIKPAQLAEALDAARAAAGDTAVATAQRPQLPQAPSPLNDTPAAQARELAARAHRAIADATREIELQLGESRSRRAATPRGPQGVSTSTFTAQVVEPTRRPDLHSQPSPAAAVEADLSPAPHDNYLIETTAPVAAAQRPTAPVRPQGVEATAAELTADLRSAGVDDDVAEQILHRLVVHRVPFAPQGDMRELLRDVIAEAVSVETGWLPTGRQHRMAVVGPSGAGKSTVVAKIAESYQRVPDCRVGVVSIVSGADNAAADPLLRRTELDVRFAADAQQLLIALERLAECDLVIIDTPSAAYLDPQMASTVNAGLTAARVDDVHVVVPLATSVREVASVVEHFRPMGANRLIVTKLDESRYAGQLLNYGFRFGLPITYLADGPRVPEDLRAASSTEIAALIVPPRQTTHQE